MALTSLPPPQKRSSLTDEFAYTEGVFDISQIPIRYFLTSIPLASLGNCFKLVEDIPGSENWGYTAIFQRDIDEDRVKEELLEDYLLVTDKFKFFNPLTIALLPFDRAEQKILDTYREPKTTKKQDDYIKEQIDGVELTKDPNLTVGNIRWDTNRIIATAIDGQHRLSALLKFAASPPGGIDPTRSQIPVILLLFNQEKGDILKQVREIFVDINKTAKAVSLQRSILLDDRDVFAIMARDLVKDEPTNDDGLPYEVVDWRRDSAKPDAPHQLTSLVVLYQCVERLFGNRVRTIDSYLQVNESLRDRKLVEIEGPSSKCIKTNKQAEVLLERFRPRHKQFILSVFKNVDPFKEFLIAFRKHMQGPGGMYLKEYLFKSDEKRKDAVRERMTRKGVDDKAVIDDAINDMRAHKSDKNLLFYSIGQRSLFHWFYRIHTLYREQLSTVSLGVIADEYVKDLNFLNRIGFFDRDFTINDKQVWEGLCMRSGRLVASSGSAERIGALTLLAIAAIHLTRTQSVEDVMPDLQKIAFRKIVKALEPLMQIEEEEESDGDIEETMAEGDESEDEDFDDEDVDQIDREGLARSHLFDILRWIKDQQVPAKPKKRKQ